MGRMVQFKFEWFDEEKRTLRYVALGDAWNWKDYHMVVRVALVTLLQHPHPIDSVIDLRESTRPSMPSGLHAHVRTFGKKVYPVVSGRAIVIGMPAHATEVLRPFLNTEGHLETPDGFIAFVDDDDAARQLLAVWHAQ